jgi:hypothetical protein
MRLVALALILLAGTGCAGDESDGSADEGDRTADHVLAGEFDT